MRGHKGDTEGDPGAKKGGLTCRCNPFVRFPVYP